MTATDRPQPVTDFLVAYRRPVAAVLLLLALAAFAGGATLIAKTFRPPADQAADLPPEFAPSDPAALLRVGTSEYLLGGLGALTLAGVLGTAAVSRLAALPKPTPQGRAADARRWLVLFGGLAGLTLMAVGFAFCVEWFRFLSQWLDAKTPPPGAYRFVLALLVFVAGAGLAFAAAQPARADERDNPLVRRLVFGMNLGLSTFLLLVVLVVVNILVTLKVPNRLDTTAAGVNSYVLSDATREYVAGLSTPITLYTTFPDEGKVGSDVHRLLDSLRASNPGSIAVRYLSPTIDRRTVGELRSRFPQAAFVDDGILVTAGRDEERHAYIKADDLISVPESAQRGGPPRQEFVGEQKVMREILFLADDKARPVVYVTTGHGEIDILPPAAGGPAVAGPRRAANTLRATLEKNTIELRPLAFDLAGPKVPADAAIVIVANPTAAFSPAEAAALQTFARGGGKLVVVSGPVPTADRKGVLNVGLDGLLTEYGITLGQKFILNVPDRELGFFQALASPVRLQDPDSTLSREYDSVQYPFVLPMAREVLVGPAPSPALSPEPLLVTYPGRITWLEAEFPANPSRTFEQMRSDRELLMTKEVERGGSRILAAIASEGGKGKLAVFGSGEMFLDDSPREPHGAAENARLMSATVNWLRDQPSVANIAAKSYGYYTPDRTLSVFRAGVLPVVMASLLTAALGVGVWVVRRK